MSAQEAPAATVKLDDEKIHWDLSKSMSYGEYLDLPKLLSCQHVRSDTHNEMLFIIIHQASELWMKLSLHELTSALAHIRKDDVSPAFKMLSRMSRIQTQLIQSWDVLSTLTPAEYVQFRDALGTGSGFQSHQYRMLEFSLGNKNAAMIEVHKHDAAIYELLQKTLAAPSLYDESLRLLFRHGFAIPDEYVERDWSQPYVPSQQVEDQWYKVYSNTDKYWELYYLAEKLIDVEDMFQQWRFRHMKTVERVIGFKQGTGGTSGAPYLKKALDLRFFPELWTVRTRI
ncbi:MAG: tryptophan 2,3-dioxygenase [Alphaproteobacteria bacterium]|nr:tryptophan 2,3-dioxygenase [Alphaproteobacteria bacterium]